MPRFLPNPAALSVVVASSCGPLTRPSPPADDYCYYYYYYDAGSFERAYQGRLEQRTAHGSGRLVRTRADH